MQLTGDAIFLQSAVYNLMTGSNLSVSEYNDSLMNNSYVAWFSALEYWMKTKPNQPNKKPAHDYITGIEWNFGKSVYMINGGCNNFAERIKYFNYFSKQLGLQESSDTEPTHFTCEDPAGDAIVFK